MKHSSVIVRSAWLLSFGVVMSCDGSAPDDVEWSSGTAGVTAGTSAAGSNAAAGASGTSAAAGAAGNAAGGTSAGVGATAGVAAGGAPGNASGGMMNVAGTSPGGGESGIGGTSGAGAGGDGGASAGQSAGGASGNGGASTGQGGGGASGNAGASGTSGEAGTSGGGDAGPTPGLENYSTVHHVAPNGLPTNTGASFDSPLDFATALARVTAGQAIFMQGGTYPIAYTEGAKNTIVLSKSGTEAQPIGLFASGGSRAVIDFSFPPQAWVQDSYGFELTGSYWYIYGIDITRAGYQGVYVKGAHNTFRNVRFYDNRNTGLEINKGGSYTTVIDCDAYRNYDPKKLGGMADGFGPKETQGPGNRFIGCRAWENSDDGYDTFESPEVVTFDHCWAFRNGIDVWNYGGFDGNGNGFKVGGNAVVARNVVTHSVAFGHPNKGFDQNNNAGGVTLFNNTAYDNGTNFGFGNPVSSGEMHLLRNNISLDGAVSVSNATQSHNSWSSGFSVASGDFVSLDTSTATAPRNPDGSLPPSTLFRLEPESALNEAGVDVGLPFDGGAPNLGAF
jgi:hypothetical protein